MAALLEAGAHPLEETVDGWSALALALFGGQQSRNSIVDMLRAHAKTVQSPVKRAHKPPVIARPARASPPVPPSSTGTPSDGVSGTPSPSPSPSPPTLPNAPSPMYSALGAALGAGSGAGSSVGSRGSAGDSGSEAASTTSDQFGLGAFAKPGRVKVEKCRPKPSPSEQGKWELQVRPSRRCASDAAARVVPPSRTSMTTVCVRGDRTLGGTDHAGHHRHQAGANVTPHAGRVSGFVSAQRPHDPQPRDVRVATGAAAVGLQPRVQPFRHSHRRRCVCAYWPCHLAASTSRSASRSRRTPAARTRARPATWVWSGSWSHRPTMPSRRPAWASCRRLLQQAPRQARAPACPRCQSAPGEAAPV